MICVSIGKFYWGNRKKIWQVARWRGNFKYEWVFLFLHHPAACQAVCRMKPNMLRALYLPAWFRSRKKKDNTSHAYAKKCSGDPRHVDIIPFSAGIFDKILQSQHHFFYIDRLVNAFIMNMMRLRYPNFLTNATETWILAWAFFIMDKRGID